MALRCFLFSSDEGTSDTIRQVVTSLGIEGEACSEAPTAVAKLAQELFQIVVIDWDQQPEATMLLTAARERKPAERPLLLAIVSDDASIPKALQAGANSILKKPILVAQVADTMNTARELLRSRQASANAVQASAAAAGASSTTSSSPEPRSMRAGTSADSAPPLPVGRIETDTEVAHFPEPSAAEQTNPLRDLEPVAAAVAENPPAEAPADEHKGLEWYLKTRGLARPTGSVYDADSTPAPPKEAKPALLGYDQSHSSRQKSEPQLFSSYTEENSDRSGETPSRFRLRKGPIIAAVVLASIAIAAAPQAPWHSQMTGLWSRSRRTMHGWLNPQPVTSVTQAPASHENFARAGDEYKLPVAENIPDATTDPSQISVVPVVDPTAKKPAPDAAPADPPTVAPDPSATTTPEGQPNAPSTIGTPPVQPTPAAPQPATKAPAETSTSTTTRSIPAAQTPVTTPPLVTSTPRRQPDPYVPPTTRVPSSLKSQMATMTPDASGNKPIEAALPAIEPVGVQELTERALLTDQPPLAYPASAAGKQGTVTLEVLIGRDGTVQDAKFFQGSLAFARAAIEGVKQWKFKPYMVNGRPVSVQTNLTLRFAPGQ
jgi:protein TonB